MYVPRHKPFLHQEKALERLKGRKAFALLMAMRTGKTKVVLDDFGRLEDDGLCRNLLIIAPGGVYHTWVNAARDHLAPDLFARTRIHVWKSGAGAVAKRALSAFIDNKDNPRIFLVNVEALSSVKEARDACTRFLSGGPSMLVIDESTIIKNSAAKRTKFIIKELAPHAKYKRILSGLATPRSPLDLYSQFEFLDVSILGFRSYFAFRNRFAILKPMLFGGRRVDLVVGYRDLDELQARIEPHSFRVRLEDCYDMPAPKPYVRDVSLTDEQARLYKSMKENATALISGNSHVTATVVITQIMRLHQIVCGHTVDEQGTVHAVAENRTSELLHILNEADGKVIIWCAYDYNIRKLTEAIEREFGKGSVARFWGGNKNTREEEERRFKSEPECRFILATPDAGSRGRTWDMADIVVHYSYKNNLEHWDQGNERPKSVGKVKPIVYITLKTPNTVEEPILKALKEKIDMAGIINGDNFREWLI